MPARPSRNPAAGSRPSRSPWKRAPSASGNSTWTARCRAYPIEPPPICEAPGTAARRAADDDGRDGEDRGGGQPDRGGLESAEAADAEGRRLPGDEATRLLREAVGETQAQASPRAEEAPPRLAAHPLVRDRLKRARRPRRR